MCGELPVDTGNEQSQWEFVPKHSLSTKGKSVVKLCGNEQTQWASVHKVTGKVSRYHHLVATTVEMRVPSSDSGPDLAVENTTDQGSHRRKTRLEDTPHLNPFSRGPPQREAPQLSIFRCNRRFLVVFPCFLFSYQKGHLNFLNTK